MKKQEVKKLKKSIVIFVLFLILVFGLSCTMKNESVEIPSIEEFMWPTQTVSLTTRETLKLDLVSAYGDNEGYHPKVVAFDEQWNGYYYWIAFTPYPGADQGKENPHILASNDMIVWEEPDGFENPLEGRPDGDSRYVYNSDTHLLYNEKEDRLECFWRYVNDINHTVIIYRKYTYDGSNWSNKEIFLQNSRKKVDYLSPVVMIEDDKYEVWYVDRNYSLKYMERSLEDEKWSNTREIKIRYKDKKLQTWHLDVVKTDTGYEMLLSSFIMGHNHNGMNLYYTKSVDNIYYDTPEIVLQPLLSSWNDQGLYRSCILYDQGQYIVFYSGINQNDARGVGIAFGKSMKELVWLTQNNLYEFKKRTSKTACYE